MVNILDLFLFFGWLTCLAPCVLSLHHSLWTEEMTYWHFVGHVDTKLNVTASGSILGLKLIFIKWSTALCIRIYCPHRQCLWLKSLLFLLKYHHLVYSDSLVDFSRITGTS